MSMAFILTMIWLGLTGLAGLAPAAFKAQAGLALLAVGALLCILALVTAGLIAGLFALAIVITIYPGPMAALWRLGRQAVIARITAARTGAAA
jgi:hypothetical protein